MANLRTAWRQARRRKDVDQAAAMIIALFDAISYRDLVELRDWAEELAREFDTDPALAAHHRAAAVLGTAAEAAYHRGDYARADRLCRAGLERATDEASSWYCTLPLAVAHWLEERAKSSSAARDGRAGDRVDRRWSRRWRPPAPATSTGRGAARAPCRRGVTLDAGVERVRGREIESIAGHAGATERHYRRAVDLARGCAAGLPRRRRGHGLVAAAPPAAWPSAPRLPRRRPAPPAPAAGPTCGPRCAASRTCSGASAARPPARFSTRRGSRPRRAGRRPG
jgi:hypothetical protein